MCVIFCFCCCCAFGGCCRGFDDGFRDFRRAVDGHVPEIHLRLHIVDGPGGQVAAGGLVARVRSHRRSMFEPLSKAGAAAREMLRQAAADDWQRVDGILGRIGQKHLPLSF